MECKVEGNAVFVRLHRGEDFFPALEKACEVAGIESAGVVTGIGMLSGFELGYFCGKGDYAREKFEEPHELLALSGIILRENGRDFHLHAVFGAVDKSTKGGHLFSARVEVTAEIMLLKTKAKLKRETEPETGLRGLKLQ